MHAAVAITQAVADGQPVTALLWHDPGPHPHSGFLALADTDLDQADGDYMQMHGQCLTADNPGIEDGLHLALEHGAAHLIDGQWQPCSDDHPVPVNANGRINGHAQYRY